MSRSDTYQPALSDGLAWFDPIREYDNFLSRKEIEPGLKLRQHLWQTVEQLVASDHVQLNPAIFKHRIPAGVVIDEMARRVRVIQREVESGRKLCRAGDGVLLW